MPTLPDSMHYACNFENLKGAMVCRLDLRKGSSTSIQFCNFQKSITLYVVKVIHQNLLWHKFKNVKIFLQNFRAVALSQLELHHYKLKISTVSLRVSLRHHPLPVTKIFYTLSSPSMKTAE